LYEGRLWWFGKSNVWGSVSDAYDSFDDETEGDSGPISRSIGEGPVDVINWALPMQQLLIGTDSAELVLRSSNYDEPITPTNFTIKYASTQGSKQIAAQRVDSLGFFVQRAGKRVYMIGYEASNADFSNQDATGIVPDLNEAGVTFIAVQRQPDTRVHCVRGDGLVSLLVFEKTENVVAWCEVETDGEIEDVCVLPGIGEDRVYYIVRRQIGETFVRYVERWAQEVDCRGGQINLQADAFMHYSGEPTATIHGLEHLEGETVVAWGDGKSYGEHVVLEGVVTIESAVSEACVGLPYTADFESTKQGLADTLVVPLNQRKRISQIGLVLANTHYQGIEFGPDFDHLDPLPLVEDMVESDDDTVWEAYDQDFTEFPGEWTTDARICLRARAPKPCTVLAVQAIVASNER
jgi:hypothetical protein